MKTTPLLSIPLVLALNIQALPVQTWVPEYAVEASKEALQSQIGSVRVDQTITHIALQYWNLRDTGGVYNRVTDADATWFRDYGRPKGIKTLLTLVNSGNGFDWNLTRKACYGPNAAKTIRELLDEMDRLQLDGIDLDVEGEDQNGGPFTADDRQQYAAFVNALADSVHARGKILHISTYPTEGYGAPKPTWWADWVGKVDGINPMGYDYTGKNGTGKANYNTNQALATQYGYAQDQYMSGLPVWLDTWKGLNAVEHVVWLADTMPKPAGVALWAMHHLVSEGTWQDPRIWVALQKIKNMPVGTTNSGTDTTHAGTGKILDDMKGPGANLAGGMWYAGTDYWSRSTEQRPLASKAWTPDGTYDMALGEGTWGKIEDGYDVNANPPRLASRFEILGPVDPKSAQPWAMTALQMEFLPRDCSKSPDACWEIDKTGVEVDYSAYKTLVVGLQCEIGRTLKIGYTGLANLNSATAPSTTHSCTGNWQDIVLPLDTASARKMFRLNIEWKTDGSPQTAQVAVAGVALDQSITTNTTRLHESVAPRVQGSQLILSQDGPAQILRMNGQTVWTGISQNRTLDLQALTPGSYLIRTHQGALIWHQP